MVTYEWFNGLVRGNHALFVFILCACVFMRMRYAVIIVCLCIASVSLQHLFKMQSQLLSLLCSAQLHVSALSNCCLHDE